MRFPRLRAALPSLARTRHPSLLVGAAVVLTLAACSVELQNRQAAQELAQAKQPPGSVYAGWRVFQNKCSGCHGPDALGTASAPNLLPRVQDMGPKQFVSLVLTRYDWGLPAQSRTPGAEQDALVDQLARRDGPVLSMPAWQGEPSVNAHIVDLYAYLSARAQGAAGTGRPAP